MTSNDSSKDKPAGETAYDLGGLEVASQTDVGVVRSVNQDSFGEFGSAEEGRIMLIVADGMGGHRGGEVASAMAVEAARTTFGRGEQSAPELLVGALENANDQIFDSASKDPELAGMGTTGVAIVFDGRADGWIGHVGDSRAYRWRAGDFVQLSGDHSVVGELLRRGQLTAEQARVHPQSNEILRALGTQPDVDVELTPVDIQPGDRFLLCSDGLSGMLPDEEIAEVLAARDPVSAVRELIDLANQAGGTDNITVQIAIIPADAEARERASKPPTPSQAAPAETEAGSLAERGDPANDERSSSSLVLLGVAAFALLLIVMALLFGPARGS